MAERTQSKESQKLHEGLTKGLEVLDCLQGRPEMSLTEIAGELGLYKSRVMRICGTLERMGYVVFDARERLYRLGPRIPALARVYENTNPLLAVVKPTLETLFAALKESVAFHKLHGDSLICVHRLSRGIGQYEIAPTWQDRDMYYGARGRIVLAFGPAERVERFFADGEEYRTLTPYTPASKEDLLEDVLAVRARGYAVTSEERMLGQVGIAAPILQYAGTLAGVVSVSGRKENLNETFRERAVPLLLQETRKLSEKLGAVVFAPLPNPYGKI